MRIAYFVERARAQPVVVQEKTVNVPGPVLQALLAESAGSTVEALLDFWWAASERLDPRHDTEHS